MKPFASPSPRLLPKVLVRVLPASVLLLLGIWVAASVFISRTVSTELRGSLNKEAVQLARTLSADLSVLMSTLDSLAANDLVINGLIDFENRENYIPVFFQSLQVPSVAGTRVTMADYRGRIIASNKVRQPDPSVDYTHAPWMKRVMAGDPVLEIGNAGLLLATAIFHGDRAEGAIILEQDPAQMAQFFAYPVPFGWSLSDRSGRTLFVSDPERRLDLAETGDAAEEEWVRVDAPIAGFPGLRLTVSERRAVAFAAAERMHSIMLLAVLLSILAIAAGVAAAAYYATDPLARLAETVGGLGRAEALHQRLIRLGSAEIDRVVDAVNGMLDNLEKTTTSRDYFDALVNSLAEILVVTDRDGQIQMVNRPAMDVTGWSIDALRTMHIDDILKDATEVFEQPVGGRTVTGEHKLQTILGRRVPVRLSISRFLDGEEGEERLIYAMTDVTEQKRTERDLQSLAQYDPLTGLANRTLFQVQLKDAVAQTKRTGQLGALMLLDLDNFKDINDSLGHAMGDALLCEVGKRLAVTMRETDTVARLGGDEFAIVATNLESLDDVVTVAKKILAAFAEPFAVDGQPITAAASVGLSVFPLEDSKTEILLSHADFALYQAKRKGRNTWQFFDAKMNKQRKARKALETELDTAAINNELELYYQPKIETRTGEVTGVEALLRWNHPQRGMISPLEFIPVAEATGRIVPIGEWVIRQACEQQIAWQHEGLPIIPIAINLSAAQFKHHTIVKTIQMLTDRYGVDPRHLELELTETTIIERLDDVVSQLSELRDRGHKISIDDFGTGYASLSYLKSFPVDALKIDRIFIANMDESTDDTAIVKAVLTLAKSLKLEVVAEGVETHEQFAFLRHNGCREVQGYLFMKPAPADQFAAWYRSRHRPPLDALAIGGS